MTKTLSPNPLLPYHQTAAEVVAGLGSHVAHGLSNQEAQTRLARYGPNELISEPPVPAWRRFLAQFQDVLVILLLIATAISVGLWLYERDTALPYEGLAIFAIVLLNGLLGYVQEARAEQAVAALRAMSAAEASAIRDGQRQAIPAAELVPGDIILLEEGDTIPADGRLIESIALQTAEASMTGESLPVSKDIAPLTGETGLGDRYNMVLSGTAATYGRGKAVITATGMQTEMGKIADLLQQAPSETTPLQKELDRTGKLLGIIVLVIAAIVVATIIVVEDVHGFAAIVDALILGVALAVAAVPEGLPAVVTAVLALGVQRMARRNAIVRKLPAVETLGSATVIASDKTGTLTKNEMTVRTVVTASGQTDLSGTGYSPEGELSQAGQSGLSPALQAEVERTLRAADRANNAGLQEKDGRWLVQGDPTEGALIVAARKAGLPGGLIAGQGSLFYARTMAFTTLVLFQLINVFNARSDVRSAFPDLFLNGWLWGAILLSLLLHLLAIYLPFMQRAFSTVPLSLTDWLICFGVASTVLWLRELSKLAWRLFPAGSDHSQHPKL